MKYLFLLAFILLSGLFVCLNSQTIVLDTDNDSVNYPSPTGTKDKFIDSNGVKWTLNSEVKQSIKNPSPCNACNDSIYTIQRTWIVEKPCIEIPKFTNVANQMTLPKVVESSCEVPKPTKWIAQKNCATVNGKWKVQLIATKNPNFVPETLLGTEIVPKDCWFRVNLIGSFDYCDALSKLKEIKSVYPDAYVRKE